MEGCCEKRDEDGKEISSLHKGVYSATMHSINFPDCSQILDLRKEGSKFRCTWSDGSKTTPGYLGPEVIFFRLVLESSPRERLLLNPLCGLQMTEPMDGGLVENGGIVRVIEYNCNQNPATGEYILAAFSKPQSPLRAEKDSSLRTPILLWCHSSRHRLTISSCGRIGGCLQGGPSPLCSQGGTASSQIGGGC